jgi:arylsulfatase A-like enzyme
MPHIFLLGRMQGRLASLCGTRIAEARFIVSGRVFLNSVVVKFSPRTSAADRWRTIALLLGVAGALLGLASYGLHSAKKANEPGQAGVDRVVLVTVDTLRADHLSSYGYRLNTTPFLDSLAKQGVRFETAIASSSHTAPSHASIFTGLFPSQHGLEVNGSNLNAGTVTLPCVLAEAGFATAGFTSVSFLKGLSACFETFDANPDRERLYSPAETVLDHAATWLRGQAPSARFFLWVHLFDVHEWKHEEDVLPDHLKATREARGDIESHYRYIARRHGLTSKDGNPSTWGTYKNREGDRVPLDASGAEQVVPWIDNYDAQLRRVDDGLAKLAKIIDEQSFEGRTLWVVTADHGEGLGSHGYHGHGAHLYEEQLHVPLIVYVSDGSIRPDVAETLVRHVDILPTLVEFAGVSPSRASAGEGRSFAGLLQGRDDTTSRVAFAERRPVDDLRRRGGWSDEDVYAIRTQNAKLIWHSRGPEEFFDLEQDPLELEPFANPSTFEQLQARLEGRLVRIGTATAGSVPRTEQTPQLDPEVEAQLRGLGYIQ